MSRKMSSVIGLLEEVLSNAKQALNIAKDIENGVRSPEDVSTMEEHLDDILSYLDVYYYWKGRKHD